jgi:hypothetical protein
MSKALIVFLIYLPFAVFAQKSVTVDKIDTLILSDFKQEKVLRYSINNVLICIPIDNYLKELNVTRKTYKWLVKQNKKEEKWIKSSDSKTRSDEELLRYVVIDSVYKYVKSTSKREDTVDISNEVFSDLGLSSLVDFDKFIEQDYCAIFDKQGKQHYKIIRESITNYYGRKAISGWRKYYLKEKRLFFLEDRDWVS